MPWSRPWFRPPRFFQGLALRPPPGRHVLPRWAVYVPIYDLDPIAPGVRDPIRTRSTSTGCMAVELRNGYAPG